MPPAPGRIVPMEGLRGIAALLVLLVHFHTLFIQFAGPPGWVQPVSLFLSSIGHTGVDLFFVLSGYLMYGVMLRERFRFLPYLRRRALRLYPVFLAVFTAYVLLSYQFPEKSKLPADPAALARYLVANLLMLPGILPIVPMITQAWSLSYEWFFYLFGPFFVSLAGLRRRPWPVRTALLLLLAAGYLVLCSLGYATHPRLTMFIAGCVLWEAVQSGVLRRYMSAWGESLAVAAFLVNLALIGWLVADPQRPLAVFSVSPGSYTGLFFVTSFWFTGYALFYPGWLGWLFSADPLRWVGNISYSYYLVHGMVLHGVQRGILALTAHERIPGSPVFYLALFSLALAATLVAGAVFYMLFEKPFFHPTANTAALDGKPGYYGLDRVPLTKSNPE